MAFLFPPERAERLDSPERLAYVPVERVLSVLKPRKGQRFLDVGCGTGTYFFPVFEAMDGEGVFMAAELQEELLRRFLSRLEGYAEHPRFTRIEVLRAKPDRLPLPTASADLILMAQVWHEIDKRDAYLKELRRVLAPGGTLCLLDWKAPAEDESLASLELPPMGPPFIHRVTERQALEELRQAGFEWLVSHAGFAQNWCLTARR